MRYRFLGGVKHGQLLDVPDGHVKMRFVSLKSPPLLASDYESVPVTVTDMAPYHVITYIHHTIGFPSIGEKLRIFVPDGTDYWSAEQMLYQFIRGA